MTEKTKITWPALIKLEGDAELIYVESGHAFALDPEIQGTIFGLNDVLIDSTGLVYSLRRDGIARPEIRESCGNLSANELSGLIQAHESSLGSCCASKILFPTVAEAVRSLAYGK